MNLELFRSKHAVVAVGLVLLFTAWHLFDPEPFGSRSEANLAYLLATGWGAVVLYVVLALYAARKAAHRSGLSPEFRLDDVAIERMETVQSEIRGLQNETRAGALSDRRGVLRLAQGILQRSAMNRVLRVRVDRAAGAPGLSIRVQPREPLGRLASWVHAHVYYGVAAAFIVWFHGGGRVGSPIGLWLNVLSAVVIVTGLVGIVFWTFGPALLTRRERELSTEKAFALHEHFRRKVREQVQALGEGESPVLPRDLAIALTSNRQPGGQQLEALHELAAGSQPVRDLLVLLGQRARVQKEWMGLLRFRRIFNAWRWVHLPCSAVLLALVIVHVLSVWYY